VVRGRLWSLLGAERVALNFLCHLSGVATLTRQFVRAVVGTKAAIVDTRKTTPGLRALEKYAVRCGGGRNHRTGLYDMILLKDNHRQAATAASLVELVDLARRHCPAERKPRVEIEVDDLDQLEAALRSTADIVMLDNFSVAQLAEAVRMRDRLGSTPLLEASGGVTLENVRSIAETGVERIAVGAITHSAPALDIGLDLLTEDDGGRP
jgi:nicotinate-nucleotide pyrophosphorylase (carboxylating)